MIFGGSLAGALLPPPTQFDPNSEVASGEAGARCWSAGILACGLTGFSSPVFPFRTGDWKPTVGLRVASTRGLEGLRRFCVTTRLRVSGSTAPPVVCLQHHVVDFNNVQK